MPTTATVAKIAMAAPPSTGGGMAATRAPAFGINPRRIMKTPAAATTYRLLTLVSRTSPTFSAKQVYGKEFSTPPRKAARPSARSARATSSEPTRFSTISPVAETSPVVSTAVISTTTIIEMIAAAENFGIPKENGVVTPNQPPCVMPSKLTSPKMAATVVPISRPASTATVAMKPLNTRWMITMMASVPIA